VCRPENALDQWHRTCQQYPKPEWLMVEFTMPTEAQYKALPKIERAIRLHVWNRWDSTFAFPYTEAERERAARRKARRRNS
jgi:hypothetical protein